MVVSIGCKGALYAFSARLAASTGIVTLGDYQIKEKNITVIKNPVQVKMNLILKDFPLGRGEAAAFLIARDKDSVLATDDGLAIIVCKIFSVRFVTAIHFLINAHLDNSLALAKLELLKKYGRYSVQIIKDAEERIRGK